MTNAVEVMGLSKSFGKETVLKNVNIAFETGKIHGIVGRNGSGKTVMMKCILGFLKPSAGSVRVFGKTIGKDVDFAPDTGMLIEAPGFIPTESGSNNLKWLLNLKHRKKVDVLSCMDMVGLDGKSKKPVGKYSLGMRQRLGIAQAIMEDPKLLVLDEPMNGLDNKGVEDMRSLFLALKQRGTTIILCSHNPLDISELCDTVCEMDSGMLKKTFSGIDK